MARVDTKPQTKLQTKPQKTQRLIEFKGTTLSVVSVTLHSLQTGPLAEAADHTDNFGEANNAHGTGEPGNESASLP